jgi:hypothetical protein
MNRSAASLITVCAVICLSRAYADPPASANSGAAAASAKPAPGATVPTSNSPTDAQAAHLKELQLQLRTQGYVPKKRHNELQYCKSDTPTGSLVPAAAHCVAATDAARMEDILRENAERIPQQQCPGGQCQVDGPRLPASK